MGDQPTIHLQFIHSTTTRRSFSSPAGTASSSLQNKLQGVAPLGNRYAHDEGRKELAWFVSSSLYNFPESTTRLFRHPTNDVPLGSPGPASLSLEGQRGGSNKHIIQWTRGRTLAWTETTLWVDFIQSLLHLFDCEIHRANCIISTLRYCWAIKDDPLPLLVLLLPPL